MIGATVALAIFLFLRGHLYYFRNPVYLGGLIVIEIVLTCLWHFEIVFFPLLMVTFLWAEMNLPFIGIPATARWFILGVVAVAGFVIWMRPEFWRDWKSAAAVSLAPRFREMYHLNALQTSVLIAVPVLLGSIGRIPMGVLADRFGGRIVFGLLLSFCVIPSFGVAFSKSYAALIAWGLLIGMAGASFSVGVAFASPTTTHRAGIGARPGRAQLAPGQADASTLRDIELTHALRSRGGGVLCGTGK